MTGPAPNMMGCDVQLRKPRGSAVSRSDFKVEIQAWSIFVSSLSELSLSKAKRDES